MKRAALLIGGLDEDLIGVEADLGNFQAFLRSPAGGAWNASELTILRNPGALQVDVHLSLLKSADYSFVVFAGHGDHHDGSTRVQLKEGVVISADKLKVGAPKHTLVVDCCRIVTRRTNIAVEALLEKAESAGLAPSVARAAFDAEVTKCSGGLVTMYSCAVGEGAGEGSDGGYYSRSLVDGARNWARASRGTGDNYKCLSVFDVHNLAEPAVLRLSGNRQHPKIEKPRSKPYFPFAIG